MRFDIHLVSSENSEILDRIGADVFDDPIDTPQLYAFLDDMRHIMFVAVHEETVVGMASAVEYFHPDKNPQLWINEIGVASTHRRLGIGRSLVKALLAEAKARGCVSAWLGTDIDNESAQACFGSVPEGKPPQRSWRGSGGSAVGRRGRSRDQRWIPTAARK